MEKFVVLVLVLLLSGCVSVTDPNLKTVLKELNADECEGLVIRNVVQDTQLMFDDSLEVLNIYNPNVLVKRGETAEIGVGIMNIYSQPSQFDLRVDSEYTTIVGDGVFLEPGDFSVKSVLINAPNIETSFIVHVYLDRGGNNIAAVDVTVKVI